MKIYADRDPWGKIEVMISAPSFRTTLPSVVDSTAILTECAASLQDLKDGAAALLELAATIDAERDARVVATTGSPNIIQWQGKGPEFVR